MPVSSASQLAFYRAFLMARHSFTPADFGIDMAKEDFIDILVDEFNTAYKGQWTIDELLLHPREALQFCDIVRRTKGYWDLPDDIILRSVLQRRKNPNA